MKLVRLPILYPLRVVAMLLLWLLTRAGHLAESWFWWIDSNTWAPGDPASGWRMNAHGSTKDAAVGSASAEALASNPGWSLSLINAVEALPHGDAKGGQR